MGSMQATAYADAVSDGTASLRTAIFCNLRSNHYPPLPGAYVDVVLAAIDAYYEDGYRAVVTVPAEVDPKPREGRRNDDGSVDVMAGVLLDITHSWSFVEDQDEVDE